NMRILAFLKLASQRNIDDCKFVEETKEGGWRKKRYRETEREIHDSCTSLIKMGVRQLKGGN
ncbi:hypothetical protein, partial [Pseudomonas syringae]|uniref:hypothetical protein n=1 Tax=Pseudomonas syringae TaxID=317 RepID=UPI0034D56F78